MGTLINAGAIAVAAIIGYMIRRGLPENMADTVQKVLGLMVMLIGIQYGLKADNLVVVGLALALGAMLGEWWQVEAGLVKLGDRLEARLGQDHISEGFVTSSILFCTGAMAILGSIEDGLTGNHQILLIKSMLDGVFSLLFAASMGIGVAFSAISVLIYQGSITLAAGLVKPLATPILMADLNAWGGILIIGIGLNLIGLTKIRVANALPGLLVLPFLVQIAAWLGI
ncbi:MAG: DUF554 domain-containing protein [Methylocystaceae bacterium]